MRLYWWNSIFWTVGELLHSKNVYSWLQFYSESSKLWTPPNFLYLLKENIIKYSYEFLYISEYIGINNCTWLICMINGKIYWIALNFLIIYLIKIHILKELISNKYHGSTKYVITCMHNHLIFSSLITIWLRPRDWFNNYNVKNVN